MSDQEYLKKFENCDYWDIKCISIKLGMKTGTIYKNLTDKTNKGYNIPRVKFGRDWRFPKAEFEAWKKEYNKQWFTELKI